MAARPRSVAQNQFFLFLMGIAPYKGDFRIASAVELSYCDIRESNNNRTEERRFGRSNVNFGLGQPELRTLTIRQPGLYLFEVEAKSSVTQSFTDRVAVLVFDAIHIKSLLRNKWRAMKTCLSDNDVSGAVDYFSIASRTNYEKIFTSIGDKLPQVAEQMGDIELIHLEDGWAKCRTRRTDIVAGKSTKVSYLIYFGIDKNGLWKIDRF